MCTSARTIGPWNLLAMNKSVWLARLLSVGGVLETVTGLALIVDPAGGASALFGSSMEGAGVAIGRIGGGGLTSAGETRPCASRMGIMSSRR